MQLLGYEAFFFYMFAFAALITGVFTVSSRNPVHCALFLISTLVSIAGMFLLLGAEFIAGSQILVYVGGVMVLFLFVVMLVKVREEEVGAFSRQTTLGVIVAGLVAIGILGSVYTAQRSGFFKVKSENALVESKADPYSPAGKISTNTETFGADLYTRGALPFEIASVILLVAIVGAVMLARDRKQEEKYP
ncbi:MAG: NADH-quinone oxidoreductase subunit J [Blastocatellia bacterium]|nr:NADH-quinone oxidoreductase subunit J [Blastocatellia bacterium]